MSKKLGTIFLSKVNFSNSGKNAFIFIFLFFGVDVLSRVVSGQENLVIGTKFKLDLPLMYPNPLLNKGIWQVIAVQVLRHDIALSVGSRKNISYAITKVSGERFTNISQLEIWFNSSNSAILDSLPPQKVELSKLPMKKVLELETKLNGYTLLSAYVQPPNMTDLTQAFIRVSVYNSSTLNILSEIVGWVYFLAWSISFYPQTWLNWKRKSVIGLHFDFLSLNTVGFFLYSIFNIGLYFIPEIKRDYFHSHPFGVNPVQLNDVIFSCHAFFACIIQVIQCAIYDRGDQKVSKTGRSILGTFIIVSILAFILGSSSVIALIDFLYFVSYIKLLITLIKYIPQAYYNYVRKSTSGWSIGNILLDFIGGGFSICQMLIISYNYNDWGSIFGDPTKFGLGMFSIMFDIFFMIQHYILYKSSENYIDLSEPEALDHSSSNSYTRNSAFYGSVNIN